MVTKALKEELKTIHAINIRTKVLPLSKSSPPNTPGTGVSESQRGNVEGTGDRVQGSQHTNNPARGVSHNESGGIRDPTIIGGGD